MLNDIMLKYMAEYTQDELARVRRQIARRKLFRR